jgi:uncharacterized membrane protein
MTTLKSRLPIIFLLFGGAIRIVTLGSAAIWYDEAVTLYRTTLPLLQLFSNKSEGSGDLLLELLLRLVMWISPHSLWLLRLPSLLAGLISLWLVWLLMQQLHFTPRQQCLTALFAAVLPGLIWLGQDARAYGLLACLFLAAIWFAQDGRWLGLAACCGLMIYCHSTGPVFALGALVIALYVRIHDAQICGFKFDLWIFKVALPAAGIAVLAWIPAILRILQDGGSLVYAWGSTPTYEIWWLSGFAAAWTKMPTGLFFIGSVLMLLTLCLILSGVGNSGRVVALLAWGVPLAGLVAFSLYRNVIIYRTLMPLLIPFVLWLGWELGSLEKHRSIRFVLGAVWVVVLMVSFNLYNPADRGGQLDQVAAQIRAYWQPGDQMVYATITVGLPMEYYLGDLPQSWLSIVKDPLLEILAIPHIARPCLDGCKRFWVVVPDDHNLISPAEWTQLAPYTQGTPVYQIKAMQIATMNVYLEDAK